MYTIQEVETGNDNKQYLLQINGTNYYIGELLRIIIDQLTEKKTKPEITVSLNNWSRGQYEFTEETVAQIIEEKIKPLKIFNEAGEVIHDESLEKNKTDRMLSGFTGHWDVFRFEQLKWLLEILKYFFYPIPFFTLLLAGAGLNYYYIQQFSQYNDAAAAGGTFASSGTECLKNLGHIFIYYPVAIFILFIHELGHAASSYLFKAPPKSIGFGFYFIFPVLYTDVTETWKLSRLKRIIVNFGGIFFQLLINLGLIYWVKNSYDMETISILRSLIVINTVTIFINFNPFFRFDGYWIYSDLFKLPNLRLQSDAWWTLFLKRIFPSLPFQVSERTRQLVNVKNPFLAIYSICSYVFWGYIAYVVIKFIGQAFYAWKQVFYNIYQLDFSVCAIESMGKTALATTIFSFIFYKRYQHNSGIVQNSIKNLIRNRRDGKQ